YVGALSPVYNKIPKSRRRGYRVSGRCLSTNRSSRTEIADRRPNTRRYGYYDGLWSGPYGHGAGSVWWRDRGYSKIFDARGKLPLACTASRRRRVRRHGRAPNGICTSWRSTRSTSATFWEIHPFADEGPRCAGRKSFRSKAGRITRHKSARTADCHAGSRSPWLA